MKAIATDVWKSFVPADVNQAWQADVRHIGCEAESRRAGAHYDTGSILEYEAYLLRALAEHLRARVVIDVGTFIGTSACALASASTVETVYTCDISNDCLQSSGKVVTFPMTRSLAMLTELVKRGVRADLCFFDGVLRDEDVELLAKVTTPDVVFAVHDYNHGPKIRSWGLETVPRKGIGNVRALQRRWKRHVIVDPLPDTTVALCAGVAAVTVGFYHIEQPTQASQDAYIWARGLVASVKRTMPQADIVHLTDMTSRHVKGVHAVRRKQSEPMALLRMRHQAGVRGDWLFVDTDVIFEQSVRYVFKKWEFEIAIPNRHWEHLKPAAGFTARMPFNTGVVFSRCPSFFAEAYTRLRALSDEQQHWMGDQEVINDILAEERPRYQVKYLSGQQFNFPPVVHDVSSQKMAEVLSEVRITHYKGAERKRLLMDRLKAKQCA